MSVKVALLWVLVGNKKVNCMWGLSLKYINSVFVCIICKHRMENGYVLHAFLEYFSPFGKFLTCRSNIQWEASYPKQK